VGERRSVSGSEATLGGGRRKDKLGGEVCLSHIGKLEPCPFHLESVVSFSFTNGAPDIAGLDRIWLVWDDAFRRLNALWCSDRPRITLSGSLCSGSHDDLGHPGARAIPCVCRDVRVAAARVVTGSTAAAIHKGPEYKSRECKRVCDVSH